MRGRAGRRRPRRPAGRALRPDLLRRRRGQEHLRHRQLPAAQHRHRGRCRSKNGLLTTVGYQIGDDAAGLRAGGLDRRHRVAGAVAARQPRDDQGRAGDRGAGHDRREQRRRLLRAGVLGPVRPVLAQRRARRRSSGSPATSTRATSPAPRSRRRPSRAARWSRR